MATDKTDKGDTFATRHFKFTDEAGVEHAFNAGDDVGKNEEGAKRLADFRMAGLVGPKPDDAPAADPAKPAAKS